MAKTTTENKLNFALTRENYILLAIGFVIVIIGFFLMVGGGSEDPKIFHEDKLFSFRRTTLAPLLVLAGFAFEVYAIMKKPSKEKEDQ